MPPNCSAPCLDGHRCRSCLPTTTDTAAMRKRGSRSSTYSAERQVRVAVHLLSAARRRAVQATHSFTMYSLDSLEARFKWYVHSSRMPESLQAECPSRLREWKALFLLNDCQTHGASQQWPETTFENQLPVFSSFLCFPASVCILPEAGQSRLSDPRFLFFFLYKNTLVPL